MFLVVLALFAAACIPEGEITSVRSSLQLTEETGTVVVSGWARTRDVDEPLTVALEVDGVEVATDLADGRRTDPEVDGAGFAMRVENLPGGTHELCVVVIDGPGTILGIAIECTDVTVDDPQVDLDAARARWVDAEVGTYALTYRRLCFCPREALGPFTTEVVDGQIRGTHHADDPALPIPDGEELTIEDLFDLVGRSIEREASEVSVDYDRDLGYPRRLYVDWVGEIADEELTLVVRSLEIPEVDLDPEPAS